MYIVIFVRSNLLPHNCVHAHTRTCTHSQVISEEEKQKYQKLAEEDRERYKREVMGDYGKGTAKEGSRRGRRKKEPGQPKRNM